jgi:hypothetical protein
MVPVDFGSERTKPGWLVLLKPDLQSRLRTGSILPTNEKAVTLLSVGSEIGRTGPTI